MTKKEDIFEKLNIKDYNNYLEEILETKEFSSDTKNFLLSMLYKIEAAYSDFSLVKNLNKTQNDFVEEIIETLKNNCQRLELVKPLDEKYEKLLKNPEKCIVNKEKKEIISIYNEQALLYAIFKLTDKEYKFKNSILKCVLEELLNTGKNISKKEVIRDFDGWAWNIEKNQIESIEHNLVFQNIQMLYSGDFEDEEQLKEILSKTCKKEDAQVFFILLCKIAVRLYLNKHKNQKEKFETERKENENKLRELEDKTNYFKKIISKKNNLEKRLKMIDSCLIDINILKKEFIKANKTLPEEKKILSISNFEDRIQEEKKQIVCDIQKLSEKLLPQTYTKERNQIIEILEILEVLDDKEDLYENILLLQEKFIKGMQEKIKQAQTRKDVMSIIYQLRYYKYLPYKDVQIKDVKELRKLIYKVEEMIYNMAYKMNIINPISINEKVNNDVVRKILDTNIIELENIELLFKAENYQITLQIFDEENIEKIIEYNTIEGLIARMNKKFRLFVK